MELFYGHLLTLINLAKQIPQSRVLQVKKKFNITWSHFYEISNYPQPYVIIWAMIKA